MTVKKEKNEIGFVVEFKTDYEIIFMADALSGISIGNVVGINLKKNLWVLGRIENYTPKYLLADHSKYFVSRIVNNDTDDISLKSGEFKVALVVNAVVLGIYEEDKSGCLSISANSPNRYTSSPLQKVFLIDVKKCTQIFGVDSNAPIYGKIIYPNTLDAKINSDKFLNKHTFITGVTGSGKTMLAGLLGAKLAQEGANVIIVDPHSEYENIISKCSNNTSVNIYSRSLRKEEKYTKSKVTFSKKLLQFPMDYINPSIMKTLLRIDDVYEQGLIDEIFDAITLHGHKINLFEEFTKAYIKKEIELKAEKDQNRLERLQNIQRKIGKATIGKDRLIAKEGQGWLGASEEHISIISGQHSIHEYAHRIITAILESVLNPNYTKSRKNIIIVDEAHQLFRGEYKEVRQKKALIGQLLREARKYNTGLILVTQVIEDIPEYIREQLQNRFMFRNNLDIRTRHLEDKICLCSVSGSKSEFLMKVNDIG